MLRRKVCVKRHQQIVHIALYKLDQFDPIFEDSMKIDAGNILDKGFAREIEVKYEDGVMKICPENTGFVLDLQAPVISFFTLAFIPFFDNIRPRLLISL